MGVDLKEDHMKYLCRFDWFHNKFVTEPDDPDYNGSVETMDIVGRAWHVEAENETDAIIAAEKAKTTWEEGRDTWPEIYDNEYKGDRPIELTNGELLIKRYGKYNPNITFIISDKELKYFMDMVKEIKAEV